jgi:hypothetical protein
MVIPKYEKSVEVKKKSKWNFQEVQQPEQGTPPKKQKVGRSEENT